MIQPQMRNRKEYGRQRDGRILKWLAAGHRTATAEQIAEVFFGNVSPEWRLRKAKERLRKLVKRGLLKQFYYFDGTLVYSVEQSRNTKKLQHQLAVNDVVIRLQAQKSNWERFSYELERREGEVITDIYITLENVITKKKLEYYVEVQLDSNEPIAEKVSKYMDILVDNEEARLVVLWKHRRTETDLQKMRLPKEIRERMFAIPLSNLRIPH